MPTVFVIATLDTKGREAEFVCDQLRARGLRVTLVDAGSQGPPAVPADVPRQELFRLAGASWEQIQTRQDRGEAVACAAQGAAELVRQAHDRGELLGVLGLGGSAGTTIGTAAMRSLPLGVPKVMVSTLASGQVRPYVGSKDICMLHSVVDIAGLNRISRLVLGEAAAALAGMAQAFASGGAARLAEGAKPLIAATMFGVTTPCIEHARRVLEAAGYEVLVFHATGVGGQTMESLVDDGLIAGVLDITTTELADELVGGVLSAGPDRLTAAGRRGVPQVVSVGALDMVNFGPRPTVPPDFADRRFHEHNSTVTLMRTTLAENAQLGAEIGRKAAAARGPTAIVLPRGGVSALDRAGGAFDDPSARAALFAAIHAHATGVEVAEYDLHINDAAFAEAAANKLLELLGHRTRCEPAPAAD